MSEEPQTPEQGYQYQEPNPADYGVELGTNSCLDQCWEDFRRCLQNTTFPEQCIAQLQVCQRACADAGTS